ncbi:MAG: putative rRNA methyltransferase [Ilumatobacteraceae bacterium]|nr:putative rRNA methyltransferase [Ilumatobacteraceae bacterium]
MSKGCRQTDRVSQPTSTTTARTTARSVALRCLERIDHDGAYANLVVSAALDESGLDRRDRAFVTELVHGTTRMRRACDAVVDRFVLSEPQPEIRTLLRLGAEQLTFTDVAPHAAVAETVELAPKRARGFVNAILRNITRTPMIWPDLPTELSYPDWLFDRLTAELGDDAIPAMRRMNEAPPVTVRDDGYTQDRSSQWVAAAVGALPGELVLDMCAAPGGKATAMADRADHHGAHVIAAELSPVRAGLVTANARRLEADVTTVIADGTAPPFADGTFDRVLLDAPCSGLGALRRRPDARWRMTAQSIDELVELQRRLLHSAAPLVRVGGTLVYSVCTLTAAESIDHATPPGFEVDRTPPVGTWRPFAQGWRVLPHDADTDGMVLVRYRRAS